MNGDTPDLLDNIEAGFDADSVQEYDWEDYSDDLLSRAQSDDELSDLVGTGMHITEMP
jgi:hypothetical protein